jgi:hypothetical protein
MYEDISYTVYNIQFYIHYPTVIYGSNYIYLATVMLD